MGIFRTYYEKKVRLHEAEAEGKFGHLKKQQLYDEMVKAWNLFLEMNQELNRRGWAVQQGDDGSLQPYRLQQQAPDQPQVRRGQGDNVKELQSILSKDPNERNFYISRFWGNYWGDQDPPWHGPFVPGKRSGSQQEDNQILQLLQQIDYEVKYPRTYQETKEGDLQVLNQMYTGRITNLLRPILYQPDGHLAVPGIAEVE